MFRQLFDRDTCTYTYLLADSQTREALLIDPVLEHVERDTRLLAELNLTLRFTVDTHVHADHVTGAAAHRDQTGCTIVFPGASEVEGCQLLRHGDHVSIGSIDLEGRATPGHTSCSMVLVAREQGWVFTGDTLMIRGCGRTDFQSGSAHDLYRSVHEQLFSLPEATRVWPGHDYRGHTSSTIGEEIRHNPRLGKGRSLDSFVQLMNGLGLPHPARIDVALPANLALGAPTSP